MNNLNTAAQDAAQDALPHPAERFATVVISPRIQVQGILIWQKGAHACVEISPDRQVTGRVASAA